MVPSTSSFHVEADFHPLRWQQLTENDDMLYEYDSTLSTLR